MIRTARGRGVAFARARGRQDLCEPISRLDLEAATLSDPAGPQRNHENGKTAHGQVTLPVQLPVFQGFAWAGNLGFIHFSNPVAGYGLALLAALDIPTLSQWGLILLTLLLGAAAVRQLRLATLSS